MCKISSQNLVNEYLWSIISKDVGNLAVVAFLRLG